MQYQINDNEPVTKMTITSVFFRRQTFIRLH